MSSLNRNLRTAEVEVHPEPLCSLLPAPRSSRGRVVRATTGVAALAVTLAACSSLGGATGNDPPPAPASTSSTTAAATSSNMSFTSRVKALFSGDSTSANAAAAQPANGAPGIECPSVEYRQGAGTLAVNTPGTEPSALSVRYQVSFTQTARECIVRDNNLLIKVGIQGRIVVGPAGAPSSITIPLRYALVREGLESKTLWTKLFMVPVTIPQNQLNLPWLHIEEEMTVPRPSADELEAYVIYVGFDPEGEAAKPKRAAKPKGAR